MYIMRARGKHALFRLASREGCCVGEAWGVARLVETVDVGGIGEARLLGGPS